MPLDEMVKIDDVLLTHSHFDHIKDLPLLADVLVGRRDAPVAERDVGYRIEALCRIDYPAPRQHQIVHRVFPFGLPSSGSAADSRASRMPLQRRPPASSTNS
jgi:phosphoribosyl 1,2-cyclic phosphodiesterase